MCEWCDAVKAAIINVFNLFAKCIERSQVDILHLFSTNRSFAFSVVWVFSVQFTMHLLTVSVIFILFSSLC